MKHEIDPGYREYLGIRVVNESEVQGVRTPTGMVKVADGSLIATPVADDPKPQEPPAKARDAKRRAGRRREPEPQEVYEPPAQEPVRVELTVGSLGTVPSQYVHCFVGNRVAVLGCNMYSFIPAVAQQGEDGSLSPVLSISAAPGREYIYLGQTFTDRSGTLNAVLNEITGKEE